MSVTAVPAGTFLPCQKVPPGPNAAAQLATFCASAADGSRPSKPARSRGRMPALAYASITGASVETGVLMSNAIRAVWAPSFSSQGSSHNCAEPPTAPISNPPAPPPEPDGGVTGGVGAADG